MKRNNKSKCTKSIRHNNRNSREAMAQRETDRQRDIGQRGRERDLVMGQIPCNVVVVACSNHNGFCGLCGSWTIGNLELVAIWSDIIMAIMPII